MGMFRIRSCRMRVRERLDGFGQPPSRAEGEPVEVYRHIEARYKIHVGLDVIGLQRLDHAHA